MKSSWLVGAGLILASSLFCARSEDAPTVAAQQTPAAATEPRARTQQNAAQIEAGEPRANTSRPAPPRSSGPNGKRSAVDRLDLDTSTVSGNRELPKVMYIVPWKHADIGDLSGRPANSLLDEVLAPVDRDVFRREMAYYQALKPDSAAKAPAPSAAAPGGTESPGAAMPGTATPGAVSPVPH